MRVVKHEHVVQRSCGVSILGVTVLDNLLTLLEQGSGLNGLQRTLPTSTLVCVILCNGQNHIHVAALLQVACLSPVTLVQTTEIYSFQSSFELQ